MPALQADDANWLTSVFRPGTAPIKNVALALSASTQTYDEDAVSSLETSLRYRSVSGEWISQCGLPVDAKLLLIVDQLEDLFLLPPNPDEIIAFFNALWSDPR